jgi:hypothetical protein
VWQLCHEETLPLAAFACVFPLLETVLAVGRTVIHFKKINNFRCFLQEGCVPPGVLEDALVVLNAHAPLGASAALDRVRFLNVCAALVDTQVRLAHQVRHQNPPLIFALVTHIFVFVCYWVRRV